MRKLSLMCALALLALAGCKASGPGKIESTVAREVKQKITIGGKDWKNPIPDTPEAVQEGAFHFQHHCQVCHGLDGQNTGVPFAERMDPPVPDLSMPMVQDYADGQLKWIIENGISPSGMPGWKGLLSDDEMWRIVRYLRKLPPAGSLGVPDVYKEEAKQHTHAPGAKPHQH